MKIITQLLIPIFLITMLFSCEEEEKAPIGSNKISIGTTSGSTILYTSATISSAVESIRGNKVIEHGHCWGTETNPNIEGNKTSLGSLSDEKNFTSQLDQLSANTSYYIRPYITTKYETIYGAEITIKTMDYAKPTVSTGSISGVTPYQAVGGGNVSADGGLSVTAIGVVWNTTSDPTITSNIGITNDGMGGSFVSHLTSLLPGTTYYVRAYATNKIGTAYGNELSFMTKAAPTLASVTTNIPTDITNNSATLGGSIINDGNAEIIERGVCYNTSQNPTITDSKVTAAVGSGSFSVSVSALSATTTYYVRAYAINSQGITYGEEKSFKTLEAPVTDIDGNVYHTVTIGTQVWMVENLKTTRYNDGSPCNYYWYNSDEKNKDTYGALYGWISGLSSKLAPVGWHIPSRDEWETLINYLGNSNAGEKLKEAGTLHWNSPNTGATNSSCFSALPGGTIDVSSTINADQYGFVQLGKLGTWWSSTTWDSQAPTRHWVYYMQLSYNSSAAMINTYTWQWDDPGYAAHRAFSVRCIKDY